MDNQPNYDISVEETHHLQKKDKPSGTAISLANDIIKNLNESKNGLTYLLLCRMNW